MQKKAGVISSRLLAFGADVVRLTEQISGSYSRRHYEESCGAESRSDFVHKMQIVLKELKESLYWLRLIQQSGIGSVPKPELDRLLSEGQALANIIAKSVITAKCRQ